MSTPEQRAAWRKASAAWHAANPGVSRPRGRPPKERCICPNCGNTHIKASQGELNGLRDGDGRDGRA